MVPTALQNTTRQILGNILKSWDNSLHGIVALQRVKVWCASAATKICLCFGYCFGSVLNLLAWVVSVLLGAPVEPDRVCFGLVRCRSGRGWLWVAFNSCGLALDLVGSALGWFGVVLGLLWVELGSLWVGLG